MALVDTTAGFLLLLAAGVLALVGLAVCIFAGFKHPLFFLLGVVLASPALWVAWVVLGKEIPRSKAWDLSMSRSVAQLAENTSRDEYHYQGNIRSLVKLPAGRQWSGAAHLVVFTASDGAITKIYWQGRRANSARTYELARSMLKDLALPDQGLDSWHAKASAGGPASFSAGQHSDAGPSIELMVTSAGTEKGEEPAWSIHVDVRWKAP